MTKRLIIPNDSSVRRKLIFSAPIPDDDNVIKFYQKGQPYYQFSNYYEDKKHPIQYDGKSYKTAEHAYQAAKFADKKYSEVIRQTKTPNQARILGNQKLKGGFPSITSLNNTINKYKDTALIRYDWEETKDLVMQNIVDAKFSQNPSLRKLLLDTGNKKIVEDSPDGHWGSQNGKGLNMLGLTLERTRAKLQKSVRDF